MFTVGYCRRRMAVLRAGGWFVTEIGFSIEEKTKQLLKRLGRCAHNRRSTGHSAGDCSQKARGTKKRDHEGRAAVNLVSISSAARDPYDLVSKSQRSEGTP